MDDLHEVFEAVARYFSVLGEPTRLRILHALCQEERCVNEIIQVTGLAQANASRHLGLMYQAGMLSRRREGTQVFYKVADPVYLELCRTVSVQLASRLESSAGLRESFDRFEANASLRSASAANPSSSPVNQKETASA